MRLRCYGTCLAAACITKSAENTCSRNGKDFGKEGYVDKLIQQGQGLLEDGRNYIIVVRTGGTAHPHVIRGFAWERELKPMIVVCNRTVVIRDVRRNKMIYGCDATN